MTTDHDSASESTSAARLERAVERLNSLVNWERRDRDASMRRGLEPIRDLLARLGDPQCKWRAVHVAGTKGKGTTSALIAAALTGAGVRTGLYTSPHVDRIQERIRIDGRDVDDEVFARALERVLDARAEIQEGVADSEGGAATWFDVMTAAAFLVFAEAEVEWAVVECGLGGRLDSTNVIDGEVCVITNIDLEHTAVLGNTRAAIAREKAGIVKRGSTLVTGVWPAGEIDRARGAANETSGGGVTVQPTTGDATVRSTTADDAAARSTTADDAAGWAPSDDDAGRVIQDAADRAGVRVLRPERLAPTMLERNADLARLALDELGRRGVTARDGKPFSRDALDIPAIEAARLPARLEKLWAGRTRVVLDAAHVASSVAMVLDELARDPALRRPPIGVIALGRDKDVGAILKTLAGHVDTLVCTTVASGPLAAAENLANAAARAGIPAETAPDPERALARALDLVQPESWVLVIGSFYLAGALRSGLTPDRTEEPDPPDAWKTPRC